MAETAGITLGGTSLGIKLGIAIPNFFAEVGSTVGTWLQNGIMNLKQLASDMWNGAGEIGKAILRGDWNLFRQFAKEQPLAATAGIGAVLLIGGVVVGGVVSGIGALLGALGVGGSAVALGVGGSAVATAIAGVQQIYNFDFNKSDAAILAEINAAFTSLSGTAGESLGRALAGFIINKKETPKLKINIQRAATMFLALEDEGENDIAEEILEELSTLGWAFFRFAKTVLFSIGYINFRQWAKANIKSGIPWIDKMIASWGEEGGKPWIIREAVEQITETIEAENPALGNFLEGVTEGFGDGLTDFIAYEYH
jgi:hypothetical protein